MFLNINNYPAGTIIALSEQEGYRIATATTEWFI